MEPTPYVFSSTNVYGIQAVIDPEGNLRIEADAEQCAGLLEMLAVRTGYYRMEDVVFGALRDQGYESVRPEWIGALTDAPILTDALDVPDEGEPQLFPESKVWWYPNYMVSDPWEHLSGYGHVVFPAAPEG